MQAGVGSPVAPAPAPARQASALDAGSWFEAATPFGALRLCAFAGQAVRHALDAAVALGRCEPLLAGLHAWTGLALDWRWSATPPRRPAGSHAAACWEPPPTTDADGTPRELLCLLSLPWALLRSASPPDAALAAQLRWPAVPGILAISHLSLEAAEADLLEPGGALVLPESMHAPWLGHLRSADEPAAADVGATVLLASPGRPQLRRGAASPVPRADEPGAPGIACEVRLALPHTLPGDRYTGWHDGDALGDAGPRATLWRCATHDAPAQALAAGRLMPWGDGWALAIESLGD